MGKILLGWELGAGIGYAARLLTIARELAALGHEPVVALNDIERTWKLSINDSFPVIQGPKVVGRLDPDRTKDGFRPTGFADLMACNGFGSFDHLMAMVRAWSTTIDVVKPDLIVGEYCPLLCFAAFGRIPVVMVSHAYSLPPVDAPTFPRLVPQEPAYADQEKMFDLVCEVQDRMGRTRPSQLTDIYHGNVRFILTLPELDPYRALRCEPVSGPMEALPAPAPVPAAPRFYAYLAEDRPQVDAVLRGLAASGLPGEVYVRDTSLKIDAEDLARRGIELLHTLPSLCNVLQRASIVVNHASINTVQTCVGAGRPQLMIPVKLDQVFVGKGAQATGLGINLASNVTPEKVTEAIQRLVQDNRMAETVAAYAASVRERGQHNQLPRLVECCCSYLN